TSTGAAGAEGRRAASLRAARILAVVVFAGAALAAALGCFAMEPRGPETAPSLWGGETRLDGRGVYRRDSVSGALQVRANDAVTLVAALPLLAAAFFLARRGSKGGKLLLAGAFGYFLYTYASLAFGLVFNEYFLLYVGLFTTSLLGFTFAMLSLDVEALEEGSARYPRRSGAAFSLAVALFLGAAWIGGRVLPALAPGGAARILEHYHTLYIQVLDLGVVAPAGLLAAWWLLRRDPRGYPLGAVLFVKGATLGLAVTTMGFSQIAAGEEVPAPLLAGFALLTAAAVVLAVLAVRSAGFAPALAADDAAARAGRERPSAR
ncbi:MAG: hypothetical protein JNG85_18075, partial [Spirochaetaceae bacterium]|nr:hypothetical protein [Spirochaetaceae bacterium]